jgi:hypothetical protein
MCFASQQKAADWQLWVKSTHYAFMMRNTELFMSLWRSYRPAICKVHGFAIAGGSDIALCADIIVKSIRRSPSDSSWSTRAPGNRRRVAAILAGSYCLTQKPGLTGWGERIRTRKVWQII